MNIEIYPLDKVVLDGVCVYLGMKRADVEAVIGKGQFAGNRYYYYRSEMAIDYSDDEKIKFIEFLGGIDGFLRPMIDGVSAFDVPADELTALLKKKNDGETNGSEQGYSLNFLNIGVGLYRSLIPSDVTEMIAEMKAHGISADNNEDVKTDLRKANHWETIGLGDAEYYRCL